MLELAVNSLASSPRKRPPANHATQRTHPDTVYAAQAIEYLKRAKQSARPFFIACGFGKPHCPPEAPKKFFDLYDAAKISLPADFAARR